MIPMLTDKRLLKILEKEVMCFLQDKPYPCKCKTIRISRFDLFDSRTNNLLEKCKMVLETHLKPTFEYFEKGYSPRWQLLRAGILQMEVILSWYYNLKYITPRGTCVFDLENKKGHDLLEQIATQYGITKRDAYYKIKDGSIAPDYRSVYVF